MNLQDLAKEINKDWTFEYSAMFQDNELRLKYNHEVIALVDENFDIEIIEEGHEECIEQLTYMIER